MQGTIHRLIRGKGFGFIQTEERQYFFHHTEVRGIEFRQLTVGDVVEFQPVEEEAGKNPRAVEVSVLVKAPPPPPRTPVQEAPQAPATPKPERRPERPGPNRAGPGRGAGRPAPRPGPARRPPRNDSFGSGLFPADAFGGPTGIDGGSGAAGASGASGASGAETEFGEELAAYGPDGNAQDGGHGGERGPGHGGERRPRTENGHGGGQRRSSFEREGAGGRRPGGRPTGGRPAGRSRPPRDDDRPRRPRAAGSTGERGEGVIRSLNADRGFGFIETSAGDIFFHKSGVRQGFESLSVGSRVAFVFGEGDRGAKAEDISPV